MHTHTDTSVIIPRDVNQALGIAKYAKEFVNGRLGSGDSGIDKCVWDVTKKFHTDSVLCGISALALQANAPTVLRKEAQEYKDPNGACVFGDSGRYFPEKAIVANASAVREWDSNGTVFGYNPHLPAHQAGEFGHNDFYPVVIAAAQVTKNIDGKQALRAMICLDEIRGRLAEVFSLKTYKIDHVVHGAIASAAVYGALTGATEEQIEHAIGMIVAHYIPFRAIRAGKQLSDSKGASAALSTEVAIMSMKRAMRGFVGPKDIFRNPEAIFRWFEKQDDGHAPFNLILAHSGKDFAVCGMHFKLGLYEHQSAGALEGLFRLLSENPKILQSPNLIQKIIVRAYEPAFGIIGDPAKRTPTTRQSADHSMLYIFATALNKAFKHPNKLKSNLDDVWCELMLDPYDYGKDALFDTQTRALMDKIVFEHGGPEFDRNYPDGIPTSIEVQLTDKTTLSSGMVMYPSGHARNTKANLDKILQHKFKLLGEIALADADTCSKFLHKLQNIDTMTASELQSIYDCGKICLRDPVD